MNKNEVKELEELLLVVWDSPEDDNYYNKVVSRIQEICPDPYWTEYLDDNNYALDDDSLNIDKIVDKILSYKPTIFHG